MSYAANWPAHPQSCVPPATTAPAWQVPHTFQPGQVPLPLAPPPVHTLEVSN
jgi:hypothetical protein